MLKIHGVTRSRASRIVWLCHEIGIEFHQIPVIQAYRLGDPHAAHAPLNTRSPQFLSLWPGGTIPVIEDNSLVLADSTACNMYLARKYGPPVGPADANEEALMLQWSLYAVTALEPDALTLLFLSRSSVEEDKAMVAHACDRLMRPLQVVEDHLAQEGYMVARRFTVADVNMAEVLRYAQGQESFLAKFPATSAWLSDCQARPAFQRMWETRMSEPE